MRKAGEPGAHEQMYPHCGLEPFPVLLGQWLLQSPLPWVCTDSQNGNGTNGGFSLSHHEENRGSYRGWL